MKFVVSDDFFNKVDNAYFGIVYIKSFDNNKKYDFIDKMLEESINSVKDKITGSVKESDLIIPYREAFRSIQINPNKYMCSIEALITRIVKGKSIPSINPIVDLCNALSIKYVLPVGVHDVSKFQGTLEIRESYGNEIFIPFGSDEEEIVDKGEMIYVSGPEVKTRRWTWRQGENSKVTENTSNIFIPIDGFSDINKDRVIKLQNELVEILNNLGVEATIDYVDKNKRSFEI